MHKAIYQLFFFIHRFSVDVAMGACAMLHACSLVQGIEIEWHYYCLLFAGTLIVYWSDHLIDSLNPLLAQPGLRHEWFSTKRYWIITFLAIFILINAFISIQYLNFKELNYGFVLLFGLLIYLLAHKKIKRIILFEKELLIAALYVICVLFPCVSKSNGNLFSDASLSLFITGLMLFITALLNLFSIAIIEEKADRENKERSITQVFSIPVLRRIELLFWGLNFVIGFLFYLTFPGLITLKFVSVLLLINLVQFLLPGIFKEPKNNVYRMLGDLSFLLGFLV